MAVITDYSEGPEHLVCLFRLQALKIIPNIKIEQTHFPNSRE